MTVFKRFSASLRSAASVVILIAVWLAFAPIQIGGLASYIIVIGNSMEPKFHIGDLVVVHEQPVYRVGDAIVYRNLELKSFVFHRIVSEQLGRYTLKGDHNSWLDNYNPSRTEVVGKLWLHIPGGGIAVQKIRSPYVMALIAGIVGAVLGIRLFRNKAKGNKHMSNKSVREWFASAREKARGWFSAVRSFASGLSANFAQGEGLDGSFFALGLIALSSFILGILVFSRPASRVIQDDISYQHLGVFSYTASAPQGIYDTNMIRGGDPIFTKLTCAIDINFQYTLIAGEARNITGTYQLTAVLSEEVSGWQRIIPLQEETAFSGTAFGTRATLDLCKISSLAQSLEEGTDFHPGTYTLAITPNVKLEGELSQRTLNGSFNSGLTFRYDRVQFYLIRNEELGNPLTLIESAVLREKRWEANTVLFFDRELSIPILRWVSLLALIASASGLSLLGIRLQNLSRRDQASFLRIKYDSVMIDVQDVDALLSASIIEVASMEALAKLAERFNAVILHVAEAGWHAYYLQSGGTTYRFVLNAPQTESAAAREDAVSQGGGA